MGHLHCLLSKPPSKYLASGHAHICCTCVFDFLVQKMVGKTLLLGYHKKRQNDNLTVLSILDTAPNKLVRKGDTQKKSDTTSSNPSFYIHWQQMSLIKKVGLFLKPSHYFKKASAPAFKIKSYITPIQFS